MFYYLEGTIALIDQNLVVVDIGGAGYACSATAKTISRLETGKNARLYIYSHIKEDAFDLYGFFDLSEKRCFEHLLGVSGVGPKAALSILSCTTPESLALAVINEVESELTVAPGVGKKLAQRIILELKDKVNKLAYPLTNQPARTGSGTETAGESPASKHRDAVAALTVLGYSQNEISAALRGIDVEALSLEEIIREVLKS